MASIIKRKKNYSVVYNYVDENGETKQKWETWHTHKEALKRKAEIENQQHTGTFLPPSNQTITEFLYDFVSLYGEKKWGVSMYDSQTALIANYINPIIGDMEVQAVLPVRLTVISRPCRKPSRCLPRPERPLPPMSATRPLKRSSSSCGVRLSRRYDGKSLQEIPLTM